MRPLQKVETYPDGAVDVYAEAGRTLGEKKAHLHFELQSVGVLRYYEAQNSVKSNRVDMLIKVPHSGLINRMDIAVLTGDEAQYRIQRIQHKPERGVDLLELERVQVKIREAETNGQNGQT